MAANMKAAFTLVLEDKISGALRNVGKGLEDLRKVGHELGLGKLEKGADLLRTVGQGIRSLTSELRTIEAVADRGWAALRRMGSVTFHGAASFGRGAANLGKQVMGPGGLIGAATAAGGAAAIAMPSRAYGNFENIGRQSAITENLSGSEAALESKRLMGVFSKDAIATGQSSESVATAYYDLISSGIGPDRAEAVLPFHSRAATAYNVTADSLGHAVGSLIRNFRLDEHQLPSAVASMALATKAGLFKMNDFSAYLPGIGGTMSTMGMTGRASADKAFASLEMVSRNTTNPAQAGQDYNDFLLYLSSRSATRSLMLDNKGMEADDRAFLNKYHVRGINPDLLFEHARKKGIDQQTAILQALRRSVGGLPDDVKSHVLGIMFGNQQSGGVAKALLQYEGDLKALENRLHKADVGMLDRDFDTAHAGPKVTNDTVGEVGTQLERRIGEGFQPIMDRVRDAGVSLLGGIDALDKKFPGLTDAVLVVTGGLIGLGATLGGLGFVAPAVTSGYGLVAAGAVGLGGLATLGPAALFTGVAGMAYVGSKYETPETQAARDHLEQERRSPEGGPSGGLYDGYGPDGLPIATPGQTNRLEIHLTREPGTDAKVTHASPGLSFTIPNPGPTTTRP